MRQVTGLTSTYSSDEFGVCSALYELGGMVVMHDASGCNSTYTTHDEPRWYDQDSMIFISAISEAEAIMGDDDKLIRDLVETAWELHPKFIALVGAPIPYMIGTDLDAIARIVSEETGIPCFGFAANGMNHYTRGISMALERIVEFAIENAFDKEIDCTKPDDFMVGKAHECARVQIQVNILGATPLDFSLNGSVQSMQKWLLSNDMAPGVCLSMGCAWEDLWRLKNADVNLVVSYGGLSAARVLEKRLGIPYVVGVPFGENFSRHLAGMLKQAAELRQSVCAYGDGNGGEADSPDAFESGNLFKGAMKHDLSKYTGMNGEKGVWEQKSVLLIGESVFCASLATAFETDTGQPVRVFCPVDTEDMLLRAGDLRTPEEDDVMREITKADVVIADPLYRSLAHGKEFIELPHEAFSGRIYDAVNPNLIGKILHI